MQFCEQSANPILPCNGLQVVRVRPTLNTIDDSCIVKQCRICLQSEQTEDNQILSPCDCIGSIQYIHAQCFNSWISKRYDDPVIKNQIKSKEGLKCQICHTKFRFTFAITHHCCSCQSLRHRVSRFKFFTAASILFILLDIALIIISGLYALNDLNDPLYTIASPRYYLVYVVFGFSFGSLCYSTYEFINFFLIQEKINLTLGNKIKKGNKSRNIGKVQQQRQEANTKPNNNLVVVRII